MAQAKKSVAGVGEKLAKSTRAKFAERIIDGERQLRTYIVAFDPRKACPAWALPLLTAEVRAAEQLRLRYVALAKRMRALQNARAPQLRNLAWIGDCELRALCISAQGTSLPSEALAKFESENAKVRRSVELRTLEMSAERWIDDAFAAASGPKKAGEHSERFETALKALYDEAIGGLSTLFMRDAVAHHSAPTTKSLTGEEAIARSVKAAEKLRLVTDAAFDDFVASLRMASPGRRPGVNRKKATGQKLARSLAKCFGVTARSAYVNMRNGPAYLARPPKASW